jgi:hypothetical protein
LNGLSLRKLASLTDIPSIVDTVIIDSDEEGDGSYTETDTVEIE